jgi:hypothetical protein
MPYGGASTTYTTPELIPEQVSDIKAKTGFLTENIIPAFKQGSQAITDVYNQNVGGTINAAQNLAGTAGQVQQTAGELGESASRSGVSGLQSLFNPEYERNQIMSALAPAQSQYMQNLAQQQAQFGGSGNLGSARQALAGQQLAGSNAALQAKTAADIQSQVAGQRLQAGQALAGYGQSSLGQALGAAGTGVTAAGIPLDTVSKYLAGLYGTPQSTYNANFGGTQGSNATNFNAGFKF